MTRTGTTAHSFPRRPVPGRIAFRRGAVLGAFGMLAVVWLGVILGRLLFPREVVHVNLSEWPMMEEFIRQPVHIEDATWNAAEELDLVRSLFEDLGTFPFEGSDQDIDEWYTRERNLLLSEGTGDWSLVEPDTRGPWLQRWQWFLTGGLCIMAVLSCLLKDPARQTAGTGKSASS